MSCNIYLDEYIFSIEKVSRLKKSTIHYVFAGNYDNTFEKIFKKLENRENIPSTDLKLLKSKYNDYYRKWIAIVQENKKKIKFIKSTIRIDDSINEIKKKIFIFLSDPDEKSYILIENQELWLENNGKYYNLGSYYENNKTGEILEITPCVYENFSINKTFLNINAEDIKLKTTMNNDLIIDILNEYNLNSPIIYLYDAKDEEAFLKSQKINIDNAVIKGYFKKYWPNVELFKTDKKSEYLLTKNSYMKLDYIFNFIDNIDINKNIFSSCNILTIEMTINKNIDNDEKEVDLYNIFDYLKNKKIGEKTPFIKYDDNSFKSSFTLISKEAIEKDTIKKTDLIRWLGIKKDEHKKVNGIIIKRNFKKIEDDYRYSSILINKKGSITVHVSFKSNNNAKMSDVKEAIDDCKNLLKDINNNISSIKLKEMNPIELPEFNIENDNKIVLKSNTKIIFMNIIIPFTYEGALNLEKLYEFSKNFPNFLSKLPKENIPINASNKDDLSIQLKYNRVSGFANMNQIMTTIDILKQNNESDIFIIKAIEKIYQKSFEESKGFLIEYKKKFLVSTSSKIDPKFKRGILVTITKNNIKLDGITKIYQVPLIYKFFVSFLTLFFNQEKYKQENKNFKTYFLNRDLYNYNKSLNINNKVPENISLNINKYNDFDIDIDDNFYLEDDLKKIEEITGKGNDDLDEYEKLKSINKYYKNIGLATNDQIVSEARLTCDDKVIEKDTCEDLCNDSGYFLRRLQRYDNKLFRFDIKRTGIGKNMKQYSRQCQRIFHPVILPYDPDKEPRIKRESYSYSMKYGSDPENPHWYICPKFWCPFCEMPILESDVDPKTIKQRKTDGGRSKCNTAKCPRGNHQILFRDNKSYYPGFQEPGSHPDGYCLPCCFKLPQNNPKYKESYRDFQKCLGVDVNNNIIDNSKIYIVGKLTVLNNGKYSILSPSMSNLFKTKLKPGYLGVDSGFLRKGIKQDENNSFLACIADILTCDKTNMNLNQDKIKKILIEKMDEKIFRSLHAGNLYVIFNDNTKNITPMQNFINYLSNKDINITHKYLWDLLQRPKILFENGVNIIIFENDKILCPFGENVKNFYDINKDSILIIKTGNKYEPIYYLQGNGKTAIHTCIFPAHKKEITNVIDICKKECTSSFDINWENVLKDNINKYNINLDNIVISLGPDLQTVLNELLINIKNKKLNDGFIPVMQYLDSYNKVYAIILKNGLFLPINPSKLNTNLPYKDVFDFSKIKLLDLHTTVDYLNEIYNKTSLEYKVTHKILDLKSGNKIIAVVTQLNKIVPIIPTQDNDKKLKVSNFNYFSDVDEALEQQIILIDKRIEKMNKKNFEDESYQRMRFELSKFLKEKGNKEYFDDILNIIQADEKDINVVRQKLFKVLNEIYMQILSFNNNKIDYQNYNTPNNRIPCFIRNVISDKKNSHKNTEIFSCEDDPHCVIEKNQCKLFINKINLLDDQHKLDNYDFYVSMIIDELIRYKIKRYEILQDKIAYIINKEKIEENPKKYIIIHNKSAEDIEKILDDLYKDNMGINMDIRKLFEESTTKIYSFNKDKYILGRSGLAFSTEALPGKWEQLLSSSYVVQKNDNNSMFYSISYGISSLNNNNEQNTKILIELIKKKICTFIEKYLNDRNIIDKILKTMGLKKNNNNNNQNLNIVDLYRKVLENEKNNYKSINSDEKLRKEIMNDNYNGCIIDIIILSIIYNVNFIVLNKRYYKDIKENFSLIGPEFGAFDNNIILFKSLKSAESKLYIFNIIKYHNKYVFKQNELPKKFLNFISKKNKVL
jgi:hypothetical protein